MAADEDGLLSGPRLGAERRTEHPVPEHSRPRRASRWRFLISPQFSILLLVFAIGLLAYITTQSKTAAEGARVQAITNRTIIQGQSEATEAAQQRTLESAAQGSEIARKAVLELIAAQEALAKSSQDQIMVLQARVLAAISALEELLRQLDEADRRRDNRRNSPRPTPGLLPQPLPTCLPVSRC